MINPSQVKEVTSLAYNPLDLQIHPWPARLRWGALCLVARRQFHCSGWRKQNYPNPRQVGLTHPLFESRQGKAQLEFPSNQNPRIDDLSWDKDNDSIAILTASNTVSIWSMG